MNRDGYNGKNHAILQLFSKIIVMTIQSAQQQVDEWIMELRQDATPFGRARRGAEFVRTVLREPARRLLRSESVFEVCSQTHCHFVSTLEGWMESACLCHVSSFAGAAP